MDIAGSSPPRESADDCRDVDWEPVAGSSAWSLLPLPPLQSVLSVLLRPSVVPVPPLLCGHGWCRCRRCGCGRRWCRCRRCCAARGGAGAAVAAGAVGGAGAAAAAAAVGGLEPPDVLPPPGSGVPPVPPPGVVVPPEPLELPPHAGVVVPPARTPPPGPPIPPVPPDASPP